MVDFHDRRDDPKVTDVLGNLYGDGRRYRVNAGLTGDAGVDAYVPPVSAGYLSPGDTPNTVRVTPSTRSRKSVHVPTSTIVSIEDSRSKKGVRAQHYSRPDHVQDGYGRI